MVKISAVWVGSEFYERSHNVSVPFDAGLMERRSIHSGQSFGVNLGLLQQLLDNFQMARIASKVQSRPTIKPCRIKISHHVLHLLLAQMLPQLFRVSNFCRPEVLLIALFLFSPPAAPSGSLRRFSWLLFITPSKASNCWLLLSAKSSSSNVSKPLDMPVVPHIVHLSRIFIHDHERHVFFVDLSHINHQVILLIPKKVCNVFICYQDFTIKISSGVRLRSRFYPLLVNRRHVSYRLRLL